MSRGKPGKLRVGVVGCGKVGTVHAQAYLENPAVEFVGLCDRDPARLDAQADRLHVARFDSIARLVEQGRPQLVSVVTRWSELVAPVAECIDAGVNVLSEKPISFEPAEICTLVECAKRRGVRLGVNFNQRFTLASQWFRRLREQGDFGEMLYTVSQYNQGGGDEFYALREHMIHQLDMWRYHIGDVTSVTAQARWTDTGRRTRRPEGVAATLQFTDGALGVFTSGFPGVGGLTNYYELVGAQGRGYCENFVGKAVFRPDDGPAQVRVPPWVGPGATYWDSFGAHLDRVVEAILADRGMPVPATAAFEAQCVCRAIIQAIETQRPTEVAPVRQAVIDSTASPPG